MFEKYCLSAFDVRENCVRPITSIFTSLPILRFCALATAEKKQHFFPKTSHIDIKVLDKTFKTKRMKLETVTKK